MPTGYTAGILDGKITTFPQFAKKCMRAFGATMHMRDDDTEAEYKPRMPSDWHEKELAKAQDKLKEVEKLSDEQIIEKRTSELTEDKKRYLEYIDKANDGLAKMNVILQDVRKWQPPTSEHQGIKDFMVEQIKTTIEHDCKTDYWEKELEKCEQELKYPNAKEIREKMISGAEWSVNYHREHLKKEIDGCASSNQWVSDFINSLSAVAKK